MPSHRFEIHRLPSLAAAAALTAAVAGCPAADRSLPDADSDRYHQVVSAFHSGLVAMEIGLDQRAEAELLEATRLVRQEPAAWANLGLLALRRNEFDVAADRLAMASSLAPENAEIEVLLGQLESNRGRLEASVEHYRRAVELDPTNLKAMYALAQEMERRGDPESELWLNRILEVDPDNAAVLVEAARLAARREDGASLQSAVRRLADLTAGWSTEVDEQRERLQAAASRSDFAAAATQSAFLRNVLLSVQAYRDDLATVQTPAARVGEPMERFLLLPQPRATPAPPDESLSFAAEPLQPSAAAARAWVGAVSLAGDREPNVFVADGQTVQLLGGEALPFPGGSSAQPPSLDGIVALDFDYDFAMDLGMAGAGGLRLYRQESDGTFSDVTRSTGLASSVTSASYGTVWAADLDLEGDIDIVLGTASGPPLNLRNNGDGTFAALPLFESIDGLTGFAWADLDGDGDPDAALLDGMGRLHVFYHERGAGFLEPDLPIELSAAVALTAGDADSDGSLDVIALTAAGSVQKLSTGGEDRDWRVGELARWADFAPGEAGGARLFMADLDNSGGSDLVASSEAGTRIWLRDEQNEYQPLQTNIEARVLAAADLTSDGRLDLLGLSGGVPVRLVNRGTSAYTSTRIWPRAAQAAGDQRINSFGIGGEVELRTGLAYQKQRITGPVVHLGLGDKPVGDVARITWPNGVAQAEFDLQPDASIQATQRLKGSCPWLFAYDGSAMRFVTDFIWRSPLGMRINAQETAGVMTTEDWVKIRGDQLVPRDGYYDVRITAELWETHFFDHVELMVVDHPEGTEIYIDERFAFPPPPLAVNVTGAAQPVAAAWDDRGAEVTELIRARDERYLDSFDRGFYQGVARDHYVEVELPEDAPLAGPLWLLASGWVRPTDSSINVALSQGDRAQPRGLSLEVADAAGGWTVVHDDLGFPAGKSKTIMIDLQKVLHSDRPRRIRLRTNLEVYWDQLAWAIGKPASEIATRRVEAEVAELRYRGFSEVNEANRSSPEYPSYDQLQTTAPLWRDLIGYYTRFGDVRELLREIDDRYVIMNAGDEMALRFPALSGPPEGWVRDFVLIGDGWIKDGDFNTAFSKTVLPLPSHDRPHYTLPPGLLIDDPAFRLHSNDWQEYHTRYVTTERFQSAMLPKSRRR